MTSAVGDDAEGTDEQESLLSLDTLATRGQPLRHGRNCYSRCCCLNGGVLRRAATIFCLLSTAIYTYLVAVTTFVPNRSDAMQGYWSWGNVMQRRTVEISGLNKLSSDANVRFMSFRTPDFAGFNNKRQALLHGLWMARMSNRTLVLPMHADWMQAFDLPTLSRAHPIIDEADVPLNWWRWGSSFHWWFPALTNTEAWTDVWYVSRDAFEADTEQGRWLSEHHCVYARNRPYRPRFIKEELGPTSTNWNAPLLHFDIEWGYLQMSFSGLPLSILERLERWSDAALRIHPEWYQAAKIIWQEARPALPSGFFVGVHWRLGDFEQLKRRTHSSESVRESLDRMHCRERWMKSDEAVSIACCTSSNDTLIHRNLSIYIASDQPPTHPRLAEFVTRGAESLLANWMRLTGASSHVSTSAVSASVSVRFWSDLLPTNSSLLGPFGLLSGLDSSLRSWSGLAGLLEALILKGAARHSSVIDSKEDVSNHSTLLPCFVPTPMSTLSELVLQVMRSNLRDQEVRSMATRAGARPASETETNLVLPSATNSTTSDNNNDNQHAFLLERLEHDVQSFLELIPYPAKVRPAHFKLPTAEPKGQSLAGSCTNCEYCWLPE